MHDYSLRGHPRERLIFYIAAATFSLMPLVTTLKGWLGVGVAITAFAVFSSLFTFFDRILWRNSVVRKLFRLPDLNGSWLCAGSQIDDDGNVTNEWTADVTVTQTWSRISVALQTESSRSRSGPASIECDEGHGFRLLYNYQNDPSPGEQQLSPHRGTCELIFNDDCTAADGVYFNDHNRKSFGRMKLTKQSKETE